MRSSFLFIFCCLFSYVQGLIVESHDIRDLLKYADQDSLVVTDIDGVLIQLAQTLGSEVWADHEIKKIMQQKKCSNDDALDHFMPLWHKILIASRVEPVESRTTGVIRKLQKQKIKIIGLTARHIEMAYPTQKHLRSIGIDLSRCTVSNSNREISTHFAAKYIDGIIFAGAKNDKGKTLLRFLDLIDYQSKKIVFIDDIFKNVKDVQAAVEARGIPFIGIRYGFMDDRESKFDAKIADLQYQYFQRVLPDEQAKELLNSDIDLEANL